MGIKMELSDRNRISFFEYLRQYPYEVREKEFSKNCTHKELELLPSENVHTICYRCKECGHLIFL